MRCAVPGNHHRAVRLSSRVAVPQPGDQCDADDEVLVDRFLGGDHAAFNALVLRYTDRLHRFVGWSVGSDEADDATQDVFVEAYRSLVTWRRRSTFRTWLYGVARNVCRHHLRQHAGRGRFHDRSTDVDDVCDDARGPLQRLEDSNENAQLIAYIARLPWEQRVTLMLRAWEGLSYDEIAAVMEVPKGTVRSRLHSARRVLAQAIAGDTQ